MNISDRRESHAKSSLETLLPFIEGDEMKEIDIDWLTRDTTIFVDTSSFLEPGASAAFVDTILPKLTLFKNKLWISTRTIDYLGANRVAGRSDVSSAFEILHALRKGDVLIDAKDPHESVGDPYETEQLFKELFVGFQHKSQLCLITQNQSLAFQIAKNARSGAFEYSKLVVVCYIDNGEISNWIPRIKRSFEIDQDESSNTQQLETRISREFKIVADTSSLMLCDKKGIFKGKQFFQEVLLPLLVSAESSLIVPMRVIRELENHAKKTEPEKSAGGRAGLEALALYEKANVLIKGEDKYEVLGAGENFADPVFLKLAIRFQDQFNLCFITQDRKLARTLLDNKTSLHRFELLLLFVDQYSKSGKLQRWDVRLTAEAEREARAGSSAEGSFKSNDACSQDGNVLPQRANELKQQVHSDAKGRIPAVNANDRRGQGARRTHQDVTFEPPNGAANGSDAVPQQARVLDRRLRSDRREGQEVSISEQMPPNSPNDTARNTSNFSRDRFQGASPKREPDNAFPLLSQPVKLNETLITVKRYPREGVTVIGRKTGPFTLTKQLAVGGEGTIYDTNIDDQVCKIYHENCLIQFRRDKLEMMLSRNINVKGVCWPTELVFSRDDDFLGFLMPKVQGKMMKTGIFAKPLLAKTFPHWNKAHLVQLSITILRLVEQLHALNIFIGDVNPLNILVKDEMNAFLVDVDSFQVAGFPCPVGTDTFTPPGRQGIEYKDFLRTSDDEMFAVTTLLFMILFPGKAPYSSQGGGEAAENIRNHRFPYGKDAEGRPPVGAWQFIWSHLHPKLKADFSDVFGSGKRVHIGEFVEHLLLFRNDIKEGRRNSDIFPSQPALREGETVRVTCCSCPPERAEQDISKYLAERLLTEGRAFKCNHCIALQKMARLETTREVECTSKISKQCAGKVTAPIAYLEMLQSKGQSYWCKACSAEKRIEQTRSSQCFVATATFQSQSAPEVIFLRYYRDNVLQRSWFGRCLTKVYYRVGPALASIVETFPGTRESSKLIVHWLIEKIRVRHNITNINDEKTR